MGIIAPEVNPEPIPSVRLTPGANSETFGGGPGLSQEGQEIQKLAMQGGEIGAFEKIRADQTAVQQATAQLSAVHTELLTNRETGLPSYRGTNAMAGQDKLWAQYQKSANDISESLTGQQQKGAFAKIAIASGDAFLQHVKAHVAQELDQHDSNTFEALVQNKSNESATMYGNTKALAQNQQLIEDATRARAQRLGLDDQQTEKLMRVVNTNYHETVLSQMVNDPNFQKQAKAYFNDHYLEMDTESRDRVRQLFDTVPKQQEASAKAAQSEYYKQNMRTALTDMFDGKLTLSEAQRRFRENQLDKGDYDILESKLSKPDAAVLRSIIVSKPETFNQIRQAQLTGSKSPGEIQRMIAEGSAAREITPDDGKYLMGLTSEQPPTARDKYIESRANNLRDFGNRYFAEKNLFGMATNQDKTSDQSHALVSDFYNAVDRSRASGEKIDEIVAQIKKTAMQQRYPGLGNLDKAPDVVIDVKGNVTRLLDPDQHSALKPRYKIISTGPIQEKE